MLPVSGRRAILLGGAGGVDDFRGIHDGLFRRLRHTYLTLLSRSGASPQAMQMLARHSDIRLTLGRYAHASLHHLGAAVDALPVLSVGNQQQMKLRATGS